MARGAATQSRSADGPAPFVEKIYQLVNDPELDHILSWSSRLPPGERSADLREENCFVVWQPDVFAHDILPTFTKSSNFCSFVRQLNGYGFAKVSPRLAAFSHPDFEEGQPDRIRLIRRRRVDKRRSRAGAGARRKGGQSEASASDPSASPPAGPALAHATVHGTRNGGGGALSARSARGPAVAAGTRQRAAEEDEAAESEGLHLRRANAALEEENASLRAHLDRLRYGFHDAVTALSSVHKLASLEGAAEAVVDSFANRQLALFGTAAAEGGVAAGESLSVRLIHLASKAYTPTAIASHTSQQPPAALAQGGGARVRERPPVKAEQELDAGEGSGGAGEKPLKSRRWVAEGGVAQSAGVVQEPWSGGGALGDGVSPSESDTPPNMTVADGGGAGTARTTASRVEATADRVYATHTVRGVGCSDEAECMWHGHLAPVQLGSSLAAAEEDAVLSGMCFGSAPPPTAPRTPLPGDLGELAFNYSVDQLMAMDGWPQAGAARSGADAVGAPSQALAPASAQSQAQAQWQAQSQAQTQTQAPRQESDSVLDAFLVDGGGPATPGAELGFVGEGREVDALSGELRMMSPSGTPFSLHGGT